MSVSFVPIYDQVLIKEIPGQRDVGGIELPGSAHEEFKVGEVRAVGEDAKALKKGDLVMYPPYAGVPFLLNGEEFFTMAEREIKGKLVKDG